MGATIAFGYLNGLTLWLSGGQSVGKAYAGLVVRETNGMPVTQEPSELARLILRCSAGYVLVDVFLLGSALALRDRRRRAVHDVVFGFEVVTAPTAAEDWVDRLSSLSADIDAGLELVSERWGAISRLLRWSSNCSIPTAIRYVRGGSSASKRSVSKVRSRSGRRIPGSTP